MTRRYPKHAFADNAAAQPYRVASRVTSNYKVTTRQHESNELDDLVDWLESNCKGGHISAWVYCGENEYRVLVGFREAQEALMFKLAWGGR